MWLLLSRLVTSFSCLRSMVNICKYLAGNHSLTFSTNPHAEKSKTKFIYSQGILFTGTPLPWVEKLKHLGNILQNENSVERDAGAKRGQFIGKIHSLNQDLYFSSLQFERFYSSWNFAVKIIFKLPHASHKYLIESISESLHPKVMMCSRFISHIKLHGQL